MTSLEKFYGTFSLYILTIFDKVLWFIWSENVIYTYKNEIPSVCVCVCLLVITSAPEVWLQVYLFGIGTKPNVLGAF